jgi:hypothetical protein
VSYAADLSFEFFAVFIMPASIDQIAPSDTSKEKLKNGEDSSDIVECLMSCENVLKCDLSSETHCAYKSN